MRSWRHQRGVSAILFVLIILSVITIITLFTARVIVTDNKIFSNVDDSQIAYNAAQAGFDYALGYLNVYPYLVLNGLNYCAVGNETYSLTSGSLPNGATYAMTYRCVSAGSFAVLRLTATGSTTNGASRTIQSLVSIYCGVNMPIVAQSNVTISNTATVTNATPGATQSIDSAGRVRLQNSATVTTATGGSYSCAAPYDTNTASTCLNIRSNNSTPSTAGLLAMTTPQLRLLYTGYTVMLTYSNYAPVYNFLCSNKNNSFTQTTTFANNNCTNSGSGGTSGVLGSGNASFFGKIIYIYIVNRTLTLTTAGAGAFVLGSPTNPVLLVVNADTSAATINITTANNNGASMTIYGDIVTISNANNNVTINEGTGGKTIINGSIIASGNVSVLNGAIVNGSIISGGTVTVSGDSQVNYNLNNMTNVPNARCGGSYAVVPGSWRDF